MNKADEKTCFRDLRQAIAYVVMGKNKQKIWA